MTTGVAADGAVSFPSEFVAVTVTMIVLSISAFWMSYVLIVAPVIALQFLPSLSHRLHW